MQAEPEPIRQQFAAPFKANLAHWDEVVPIHVASKGYNLEGFLRGEKTLNPVEMAEVGDVRGKRLVHLQCHFGMDTLNWARLGAQVSGLDFSPAAIEQARVLARQVGIAGARFIVANVYDAVAALGERYEIVYTGIGALTWLPDVRGWAQVVAGLLEPGGFLYLYEGHPMVWSMDDEREDGQLVLRYPYFEQKDGFEETSGTTYVDGPPVQNQRTVQWNRGLGEIVTALIDAGLRLDFLHEHRDVVWRALPWLVSSDEEAPRGGRYMNRTTWRLPPGQEDLCPLMFSLKATRPL